MMIAPPTMTLTAAFVSWVEKDPGTAALVVCTIGGAILGTFGDLLARVVDGEKYPTLWNIAKAMQNAGIALPTLGQRLVLAAKGVKPSDTPPPPGAT